jgi:hypothetical protein
MIEERYYDKTFTPSLEREILDIQHELSLIEVRVKLQQAQEQIRIVPAEEVSKPRIVRSWIEVALLLFARRCLPVGCLRVPVSGLGGRGGAVEVGGLMSGECSIVHGIFQCGHPAVCECYACGPICRIHAETQECPFGIHQLRGHEVTHNERPAPRVAC